MAGTVRFQKSWNKTKKEWKELTERHPEQFLFEVGDHRECMINGQYHPATVVGRCLRKIYSTDTNSLKEYVESKPIVDSCNDELWPHYFVAYFNRNITPEWLDRSWVKSLQSPTMPTVTAEEDEENKGISTSVSPNTNVEIETLETKKIKLEDISKKRKRYESETQTGKEKKKNKKFEKRRNRRR